MMSPKQGTQLSRLLLRSRTSMTSWCARAMRVRPLTWLNCSDTSCPKVYPAPLRESNKLAWAWALAWSIIRSLAWSVVGRWEGGRKVRSDMRGCDRSVGR